MTLAHFQWAVLLGLPTLLALNQFSADVFKDDAIYVVVAREMLHGVVPYKDVFDQKPPVIYLWYAAVTSLGGGDPAILRLSLFLTLGATAVVVWRVARHFFSTTSAFASGITFAASTSLVLMSRNGSIEQLMLLPMTASLWAFVVGRERGSLRLMLVAGALGGLAAWTKPVALFNLGALAGFVFFVPGEFGRARCWTPVSALAVGVGASCLPFVVWLAAAGALPAAFDAIVTFNREYGAMSLTTRASYFVGSFGTVVLALGPLIMLAVLGSFRLTRVRGERASLLLLWAFASVIGAEAIGYGSPHYFVQLLPSLSLLAGGAFENVSASPRKLSSSVPMVVLGLLLLLPTVLCDFRYAENFRRPLPDGTLNAIRAASDGQGTLYVHGHSPELYVEAGMLPTTRYFFPAPLLVRPSAWEDTIAELKLTLPDVIVDDPRQALEDPGRLGSMDVDRAPLDALLVSHYRLVAQLSDGVAIYRRSSP